jgi:hypothetical protein
MTQEQAMALAKFEKSVRRPGGAERQGELFDLAECGAELELAGGKDAVVDRLRDGPMLTGEAQRLVEELLHVRVLGPR